MFSLANGRGDGEESRGNLQWPRFQVSVGPIEPNHEQLVTCSLKVSNSSAQQITCNFVTANLRVRKG